MTGNPNCEDSAQTEHRGFRTEAALVAQLANFLTTTSRGRFDFYAEHEAGFGRPDLLLFRSKRGSAEDVATLAFSRPWIAPLLSQNAAKRIRSVQDLAAAAGTSIEGAKRVARQLEALGRLVWTAQQEFQIKPLQDFPYREVVAVEVKLRDWRRALVQAYRYLNFATESWVVLDHSQCNAALNEIRQFTRTGVGLATFSIDAKLNVHQRARTRRIPDSALAWRTQSVLACLP